MPSRRVKCRVVDVRHRQWRHAMSRRALPEPADMWIFDQIETEVSLGYSIAREMLDNNLYRGMFGAEPVPGFRARK